MRGLRLGLSACLGAILMLSAACSPKGADKTLTIATVNNNDMIVMQKLSPEFEKLNPGVKLKWVVLDEGTLRQRVTTDIATKGGQFDVITIGNYEVPIWARQGWLKPITPPADYEVDDLLGPVRDAVTYEGAIYALPFYAESAMTYYRTDLFKAAGLTMPEKPSYGQVMAFAARLNDPSNQVYGLCLRGKPGWGENIATITAMVHAYGGRWFDPQWNTTIDSPEWRKAITLYSEGLRKYGPPGATSNGFNENLALFAGGHCAMWIDATVAASMLNGAQSQVKGKVGYAAMPHGDYAEAPTWLWSWNLAAPASTKQSDLAAKFITWATSKTYIGQVAASEGWLGAPPGTRQSTYANPDYVAAAPFAGFVKNAIDTAMPAAPGSIQRPYGGAQFAAIPEFQSIGAQVGQTISATLTGEKTVDQALKESQAATARTMQQAGYPK